AREGAHQQWRNNIFKSVLLTDIRTVEQFDAAGALVTPAEIEQHVRVSADPQQHLDWLKTDIELGFDELILHNVNTAQAQFIDTFGETVIPALTKG
ncbi:MAG: hypothetical protein WBG32_16290, partial [Nodosilinea sp.]